MRSREGPVSLTGGGGGARCLPHTGPGHRPLLAGTQEHREQGRAAVTGGRVGLSGRSLARDCPSHPLPGWGTVGVTSGPSGNLIRPRALHRAWAWPGTQSCPTQTDRGWHGPTLPGPPHLPGLPWTLQASSVPHPPRCHDGGFGGLQCRGNEEAPPQVCLAPSPTPSVTQPPASVTNQLGLGLLLGGGRARTR